MQSQPSVSVIMPVYNASRYLKEAIESILNQTFNDFEFIIINDGSTDNTEDIIFAFKDQRLRYIRNSKNEGLIFSLNRGLEEVKGKYIARMDGDDVSSGNRFEVQFDYLEKNPSVTVLTSLCILIDETGKDNGYWPEDKNNIDSRSIRTNLPKNNCISHPTLMIKAEVLKKYKYNITQPLSEDYDLWLRLAADGLSITKLATPLLKHRILNQSFTRLKNTNVYFKLMKVKFTFVKECLDNRKINVFIFSVLLFAVIDFFKGVLKMLKNSSSRI